MTMARSTVGSGAIGRTSSGERVLLLEPAPGESGRWSAVPYPVCSRDEPLRRVAIEGFSPEAQDEASARVLRFQRRAAVAAAAAIEASNAQPRESASARPVRTAMVLCAGLGLRLRPLTERLPKPAVPFFRGPLARYTFALLARAGIERVVINTHHLPDIMERVARQEAERFKLVLERTHEPVIQGTGGGIREARRFLESGTLLLLNGDAFLSLDLRALIARHRASGASATMAVVPMPPDEKFGAVEATAQGAVRRISGHGPGGEALTPWHFLGAHVIEPEVFGFIPPGEVDINHVVYPAMIEKGRRIQACPVAVGAWADMGTPRRYLQACEELMTGLCDLSPFGGEAPLSESEMRALRAGGRAARAMIDASAKVGAGVVVAQGYIGPDCVVGARAAIRRSAVLSGTPVAAGERIEDAIAFQDLRIPAIN